MTKNDQTSASNIIFSYVPLLRGRPGAGYMGEEAVRMATATARHMEELPTGSALAALWAVDDETPTLMLLMERAAEIAKHLVEWSEGRPEDWFELHHLEKGNAYAVALFPNFVKSAERWRTAFQMRYGFPPPAEGNESHLFRPLHCVSPSKDAFSRAKPYVERSRLVKVSLVDAKQVHAGELMMRRDGITAHDLGLFKATGDRPKKGITSGWLEDAIDSMRKDMREAGEL